MPAWESKSESKSGSEGFNPPEVSPWNGEHNLPTPSWSSENGSDGSHTFSGNGGDPSTDAVDEGFPSGRSIPSPSVPWVGGDSSSRTGSNSNVSS